MGIGAGRVDCRVQWGLLVKGVLLQEFCLLAGTWDRVRWGFPGTGYVPQMGPRGRQVYRSLCFLVDILINKRQVSKINYKNMLYNLLHPKYFYLNINNIKCYVRYFTFLCHEIRYVFLVWHFSV